MKKAKEIEKLHRSGELNCFQYYLLLTLMDIRASLIDLNHVMRKQSQ